MSKEMTIEDYRKELVISNMRIRKLEKSIRGYKGLAARKDHVAEQEKPQTTASEPTPSGNTASPPHYVGPWQKYCADCGGPNPDFKDETVCDTPGCGMHLGSQESLKTLKACPNCGGTGAKLLEVKAV